MVRFINCLASLPVVPHLASRPTSGSDHAAYSRRGSVALDTERLTTLWISKAMGPCIPECRGATDPTAKGYEPDGQARRFSGMTLRLVLFEHFHQVREHGFPPFPPHCRKSTEVHSPGVQRCLC